MLCPRCHRAVDEPAPSSCPGCGAPLRLPEDRPSPPLDAPLALDRRRGDRPPPRPEAPASLPAPRPSAPAQAQPPPSRRAELADVERSHWDLRPTLAKDAPRRPPPGARAPAGTPPEEEAELDVQADVVEVHVRRAEPWRRAAAWAVDGIPFLAGGYFLARSLVRQATAGLPAPATGLYGFLDLVARERVIVLSVAVAVALALAVYGTLAHALAGATLGKRLLGLRVVGPDGGRPSLARSAARAGLAILSGALLGLGFLLALFTGSGRALHDLLARTWVVAAP